MKTLLIKATFISGMLCCSSLVAADVQPTITSHDMDWMKQQQKSIADLQETLRGQSLQLPQAQQDRVGQLQNEIADAQAEQNSASRTPPAAVYFVSLSIPKEGLLPMLSDAHRYNIPPTLRGLLDNDFRKTAAALFELTKKNKDTGVQIDPTLFEKYGIKAVPALVVNCPGHFDVISGSLPLKQALERVEQQGDCKAAAQKILESEK